MNLFVSIVRQSIADFHKVYKKYIVFSFIYMLITSFVFVPVISFILNRMLLMLGSGSLLNGDVYKIALNPTGLVSMLLISLISVIIFFLQFGVLIIIAQQTYFSKAIFVWEALITTLRKLPNLLRFSSIILLFIIGLVIPFIDITPIPAILDFNVSIYLTNLYYHLTNWWLFVYVIALVFIVYVLLKFIFTLHFIIIEDQNIWNGMKRSWHLTKGNFSLIITLFLFNVLFFIIGFMIIRLFSFIPDVLGTGMIGEFINNYLLSFFSFVSLLITIFILPVNFIIITRLFFYLKKRNGELIIDELTLSRSSLLTMFEKKVIHFFKKRRAILVASVAGYFALIFFINYTVNVQSDYLKWNVQVAAHRGDISRAPENTISSIRHAIEMGVDAVEIDVMLTKDMVAVLHHDQTLTRTIGVPYKVAQLTYGELSQYFITHRIDEHIFREKIPTLNEALIEMKDENISIIIDVKVADTRNYGDIAERIVHLVNEHELKDKVYVQSFHYDILQEIRQRDEEIKIGQILFLSAGNLRNLDVDFYTVRQTMLSDRLVKNARRLDREVWVWTVNHERNINEVLKYDIHGIITDYPEKVLR